jgi:hypothetical protein
VFNLTSQRSVVNPAESFCLIYKFSDILTAVAMVVPPNVLIKWITFYAAQPIL